MIGPLLRVAVSSARFVKPAAKAVAKQQAKKVAIHAGQKAIAKGIDSHNAKKGDSKPRQTPDIRKSSKEELYKHNKSTRDMLMKRLKRLESSYAKDPKSINPRGLQMLREGIPMTSKSMSLNEQRVAQKQLDKLANSNTTTVRGAKHVMNRQSAAMLGINYDGKLTAKQKKAIKKQSEHRANNPEFETKFWEAYNVFKANTTEKYDIRKTVSDFREAVSDENIMNWDPVTRHNAIKGFLDVQNAKRESLRSDLDDITTRPLF